MTKEHQILLVKAALQAPSGDNCHPWKFLLYKDKIRLVNLPSKDDSLYAYNQYPSMIAHGAAIENIVSQASVIGYGANVRLFPDADKNVVADIVFFNDSVGKDQLSDYIFKRITNRKHYKQKSVPKEVLLNCQSLLESDVELKVISDPETIPKIAKIGSLNEFLVLTNPYLHKFLFTHVKWGQKDLSDNPEGLYIRTLEMNFVQRFAFKLASNRNILQVLNKLHFAEFVASENEKVYKSSACFFAFVVKDTSQIAYVKLGRSLQKIWLYLTSEGISGHPLTGVVLLNNLANQDGQDKLDSQQVKIVSKATKELKNLFEINEGEIAFMMRVGYADPPSDVSPRRKPEEVMEWVND